MSDSTTLPKPALSFAEACDRGKVRQENQDSVRNLSTPMGDLVIVADGIGGYRGGGTASRIVVESFASSISAQPPDASPARAIAEASASANTHIREAAESGDAAFHHMGSTAVMALITTHAGNAQAWIGHIGDSRAYLSRGGSLTRLTRDHSTVQALLDQNVITAEQARTHPDASVLTRSLGHQPEVEIEISMTDLEDGDTLLLCTDGLWGYVSPEAIENVVLDPQAEVGDIAKDLLDLALEAGGPDNIGIEVVRYATPAAPEPPVFDLVYDETPPRRRSTATTLLIFLLVIAGGALLGWFAARTHLIPELHLPH